MTSALKVSHDQADNSACDVFFVSEPGVLGNDFLILAASWENQQTAYAKTKTQISFAVTAKLISAFVFATRIVQFLLYLTPKFQAFNLLL